MATLAIADNADGTGVVATVSGGTGTAVNTLYRQSVDGQLGTATWTATGTPLVGNGTIAGAVANGYYWWKVVSVDGATTSLTNLVYQPSTDGLAAVQDRILDAVKARIQLLTLTGIQAVERRKTPPRVGENVLRPCVIVTTFDESETTLGGTTGHDDYGRPVLVYFYTADAHDDAMEGRLQKWRQQIFRAFHAQRLAGVAETYQCEVEPRQIVAIEDGQTEAEFSAFLLRFATREVRGFGA